MEKWTSLNMELRSFVISRVLRLEQTSNSLMRTILRLFKNDLKTLGDKSSALSFKSKIDLLYDLEEIDKTDYSHLIKLMEIRNQFAHNHNAVTFESLDEINPEINKYLTRYQDSQLDKKLPREEKLKVTFNKLFEKVCGRLLTIEMEYLDGVQEEYKTHINNKALENIDKIWNSAYQMNVERTAEEGLAIIPTSFQDDLEFFKLAFKVKLSEFTLNELGKIKNNEKEVFRKKVPVEETLKRLKEKEKEE